ncbi:hypothetical protein GCM10011571_17210 [Marinithermofilum abyssi]|uniref:Carbohydrate kinase PfkB domain-containing protein n=1 Tax=Marinithermofilum abyssi TaxID=1571185 RepID=A0A8J2VBX6_9BACL|nr:PfkB family carbohydrate kinase [Marinithermofilum abyssi]GGE16142.1 hypothetical protein GCM10011571_17210 [Marinithermofilum abyssi]
MFIFSGSLPLGLSPDTYQECIRIVQSRGAQAMLDTGGEPLKSGLKAQPFVVKLNIQEFISVTGCPPRDDEILSVLRQWNQRGIRLAIITMGERGTWASLEGKAYRINPPSIRAVNPVGSGDAFLAGLGAAIYDGTDLYEALTQATAIASSNALHARAGEISPKHIEQ